MTPRARLLLAAAVVAAALALRSWSGEATSEGPLELAPEAVEEERPAGTDLPIAGASSSPGKGRRVSDARVDVGVDVSADPARGLDTPPAATLGAEAPDVRPRLELRVVRRGPASAHVPVPGVRFRLLREGADPDEESVLGETNRAGRLDRDLPGPGAYRLSLDETSVPAGLTLSNLSATRNGTTRHYRSGTRTDVTFELVATRSLSGTVRRGTDGPVEGARIELLAVTIDPSRPIRSRGIDAVQSGAGGRFAWDDLPAGEYVIHATAPREPTEAQERLRHARGGTLLLYPDPPTPQRYVDLRTRSAAGVELDLEPTGVLLRGRVVDEEAQPVEDAVVNLVETRVSGGPWNADGLRSYFERESTRHRDFTAADGSFEFRAAPRNTFRLEVHRRDLRRLRTAVHGAACLAPLTLELDLTTAQGGERRLDDLVVETLHPFELRGTVERSGASGKPDLSDVLFDARFPEGSLPAVDVEGQERPYSHFDPRTGAFVVRCNTPRDAVEIALSQRGSRGQERVETFLPAADQTREGVVLRIP